MRYDSLVNITTNLDTGDLEVVDFENGSVLDSNLATHRTET